MGRTGLGVGVASRGVCLRSRTGRVIKGVTLLSGHPLSFGCPLWVVLLLEGMNWDVSQEELDLWQSRAGANRCQGASLQGLIVMQAVYRLITVLWVPERNTSGCWGCSWLLGITITNVSATNAQTGGSGFRGWGCKLEIGGSPVISI